MTQLLDNPQVPPLYDLLKYMKTETMVDLRVCLPGKIISVDEANRQVDVEVSVMQQNSEGVAFAYPPLRGCPLFSSQGGGVGVIMPVEAGDECLVVFSDRCIDGWILTGSAQKLPNLRMHDLSDAFVLVGLNSLANKLTTPLMANEGGICTTQNPAGAVVAVNSATSLVTIKNGTANLATSLNSLLTALTTLNTAIATDPIFLSTSPGVAAAALAANIQIALVQVQLNQLLY